MRTFDSLFARFFGKTIAIFVDNGSDVRELVRETLFDENKGIDVRPNNMETLQLPFPLLHPTLKLYCYTIFPIWYNPSIKELELHKSFKSTTACQKSTI